MFLSDKLYEIGKDVGRTEEEITKAIRLWIKLCFSKLKEDLEENKDDRAIKASFKRVDNAWREAERKLEREGKPLVTLDGFKTFVKSKPEFKDIVF